MTDIPTPSLADRGKILTVNTSTTLIEWTRRTSVSVAEFGAKGDGSGGTNDAPAIASAIAWCKNNGVRELELFGNHRCCSRLPTLDFPLKITGYGKTTALWRDYVEPHPNNGLLVFWPGSGGGLARDFAVLATADSGGGSAISLEAPSSGGSPDFVTLDNLYLSSSEADNRFGQFTLWVDGRGRQGAPIGLRDLCLTNCSVFGSQLGSVGIFGAVALTWNGGGAFEAGGSSGKVVIGGTGTINSHTVSINVAQIPGINISYAQNVIINANMMGPVAKGASVSNLRINGALV